MVVSAALKRDVPSEKIFSNRCGSETGKHLLEQSGRRRKERECNVWLING